MPPRTERSLTSRTKNRQIEPNGAGCEFALRGVRRNGRYRRRTKGQRWIASLGQSHVRHIKVRNAAAIFPTLAELGADPDAVLRSAGIEPAMFSDPDNDLSFAAVGRLAGECVKATGCESFGLRVGARRNMTSLGLSGLVSMHASTVRDALQVISDNSGPATQASRQCSTARQNRVVPLCRHRAQYRKL